MSKIYYRPFDDFSSEDLSLRGHTKPVNEFFKLSSFIRGIFHA